MSAFSPEGWVQQVRSIIAAVPEPWSCALPAPLVTLFDELPFEICLLDTAGVITFTNKPWRAFADANGGQSDKTDTGVSYLDACDQTDEGRAFGDKLRNVCSGLFPEAVFLEYPCHHGNISRWYVASACRFDTPVTPIIAVMHHCIEQPSGGGGCCGASASTDTATGHKRSIDVMDTTSTTSSSSSSSSADSSGSSRSSSSSSEGDTPAKRLRVCDSCE